MNTIRSRLAAIAASFLVATLASWGLAEITPETAAAIRVWLDHTFELLLLLGYAVIHPWIQRRANPTGAFTDEAARKLAHTARVGL